MKLNCPHPKCIEAQSNGLKTRSVVRNGSFYRKSDSRRIKRYVCKACGHYFSRSTLQRSYYQKARRLTQPLSQLLVSGVSQRRAALILRVNRKTVVRRFRFIANEAKIKHLKWLQPLSHTPIRSVQFDDLETSEHTKLNPLSVALAVEPNTRKILSFEVSRMPARGLLADLARKKYGHRADDRAQGWERLFKGLTPYIAANAEWKSDSNPHYPSHLKKHFPQSKHSTVKGGRGAITAQGELKKLRFDPIFSLNHTCAMLRANLNRLFRRTWCTTKTINGLVDHLSIYIEYHNRVLTTHASAVKGAS